MVEVDRQVQTRAFAIKRERPRVNQPSAFSLLGCVEHDDRHRIEQHSGELIDACPETATWDDLAEKARFLAAVERGIEAADRGEFASPGRIKAMFAQRDVDVES